MALSPRLGAAWGGQAKFPAPHTPRQMHALVSPALPRHFPPTHQADGKHPHGCCGEDGPLQRGPELPEAAADAGTPVRWGGEMDQSCTAPQPRAPAVICRVQSHPCCAQSGGGLSPTPMLQRKIPPNSPSTPEPGTHPTQPQAPALRLAPSTPHQLPQCPQDPSIPPCTNHTLGGGTRPPTPAAPFLLRCHGRATRPGRGN